MGCSSDFRKTILRLFLLTVIPAVYCRGLRNERLTQKGEARCRNKRDAQRRRVYPDTAFPLTQFLGGFM